MTLQQSLNELSLTEAKRYRIFVGNQLIEIRKEAIEAGKRATALRPNDQIGWTSLSLFYNRNGDIKEAEAAGTKAKILSWGGKIAKN